LIRHLYHRHKEKINYLLVGGWNTVFGYFTFVLLYFLFSQIIHYLFLLVIASILSITNAYIGYKTFVFKTKGNYVREYLRFYLVYGGVMLLNFVTLPIIVKLSHLSPPVAQGGFICITVVFSYFGHKHFSFKHWSIL